MNRLIVSEKAANTPFKNNTIIYHFPELLNAIEFFKVG
jgi:hypothetical protein